MSNLKSTLLILLFTLLASTAESNQIGANLAQLEVSLNSLNALTSSQTSQPSAGMSFGRYLSTLTMKDLGISDANNSLIINKNKFDNSKGYYQVHVLDQGGVQCGWHVIKNIFWFLNALSSTNAKERIASLANLQKQSIYDPFYTLITEAIGGCPTSNMLSFTDLQYAILYICSGQNLKPAIIPRTQPLDALKLQNSLNYLSICASIQPTVVSFFLDQKLIPVENIVKRTAQLEGDNWIALSEKETYQKALEVLTLFSTPNFYTPSGILLDHRENFKQLYDFKRNKIASLGYITALPAGISHYVALVAHKQNDKIEYFLLNSINNGYLEGAYKSMQALSSLLNLSFDEFQKILLRFFIEQFAYEEPAVASPEDIEFVTPSLFETFQTTVAKAESLLRAIKSYNINKLTLYETVYKPWILKNFTELKNKIHASPDLSTAQKNSLIARIDRYSNAALKLEIIEESDEDIEIID